MLGGFIGEGENLPQDPDYTQATAVVMTILLDNYDMYSEDPKIQKKLDDAFEWEAAFIEHMKKWVTDEENLQ